MALRALRALIATSVAAVVAVALMVAVALATRESMADDGRDGGGARASNAVGPATGGDDAPGADAVGAATGDGNARGSGAVGAATGDDARGARAEPGTGASRARSGRSAEPDDRAPDPFGLALQPPTAPDDRAPGPLDLVLPPPLPAPDARLPTTPAGLAASLEATTRRLRGEIDAFGRGSSLRGRPPRSIELLALYHQRLVLRLVGRPATARRTIALLAADVRGEVRDTVAARRALEAIPRGRGPRVRPRIRTGPPRPPALLRRYYVAAERRFRVRWQVLAAVNFVETVFGRLRNASSAGARGPMQFIPSTWAAYGLGGDIDDTRDAIMGAANYLRASGAPRDERRALSHYNRSTSYVRAVLLHARRIARDPRHFTTLYGWQVYVRRGGRPTRITGPGL